MSGTSIAVLYIGTGIFVGAGWIVLGYSCGSHFGAGGWLSIMRGVSSGLIIAFVGILKLLASVRWIGQWGSWRRVYVFSIRVVCTRLNSFHCGHWLPRRQELRRQHENLVEYVGVC